MSDNAQQKILVVDDVAANRQILGELLKAEHTVILAKSGLQALEKAYLHQPDLILLDVMMPGMDGYEVLRQLKADPRSAGIAVIFITGQDRPEDESQGLQAGASDYIAKPFHAAVVRARVALHLRMARQIHLLESLAHIDPLTELPNRRQFDQALDTECRRAWRSVQPVSVAIFDVDFFKQYNDAYGHAMGDRALQAVAKVLRTGVRRSGDLVARYGGEEFTLVMPETPAAGALERVDAIRLGVQRLGLSHPASAAGPVLTVSAGVATAYGEAAALASELLRVADERLYRAKQAGRNRVQGDGNGEAAGPSRPHTAGDMACTPT